ncbi:MAG: hypothetical protein ACM3PV_13300 [Betaproteobacteria bacterium]
MAAVAKGVSMSHDTPRQPGPWQEALLVLLRIGIGWQLLYEGLGRLLSPGWTSAASLAGSRWLLSDAFHWIAAHATALRSVDLAYVWALVLIGLALLLGAFSRAAALCGAALLLLRYAARPALAGFSSQGPAGGGHLIVDETLVAVLALCVLAAFPIGGFFGLERALARSWSRLRQKATAPPAAEPSATAAVPGLPPAPGSRRELIRAALGLPALGAFVLAFLGKRRLDSREERILRVSGGNGGGAATEAVPGRESEKLPGPVPHARIGKLDVSRLIMGGNLIGGWAHARDLLYVSRLVKTYHTDQKVFETLRLAEGCGVNTFLTNPQLARVIDAYWRREGGRIQFISDCGYKGDVVEGVKVSVDVGAHACYVHGGIADNLARDGRTDVIGRALDLARQNGVPAGIGAHQLETVQACVAAGLKPDFWVKTLHRGDYWSARKDVQNDNIWCVNPEETAAFMSALPQPWIAYKVLAAGAIHPNDGFRHAFRNGADFVCVGMYDFQVVEDVKIALAALVETRQRARRWIV